VSIEEVTERIAKIEEELLGYERLCGLRVSSLESDVNHSIQVFKELTENKVAGQVLTLTPYVARMYLSAEYHLACALFYASPGLIATLLAIASVINFIYNSVKWVVDFFKIRELIMMSDILKIISPQYRRWIGEVYGKISEFSTKVGMGIDGLAHLVQACQGGISTLGGLMGKDWAWMEAAIGDQCIETAKLINQYTYMIAVNPGQFFDVCFGTLERYKQNDIKNWWTGISEWIQGATDNAEKALVKISGAIGSLQDLENRLPAFVRENIPAAIWEGLNKADAMIDGTLLPALSRIDRTFSEVNAVLEAHRQKAASLVDQLTRPGDVLLGVDKLTDAGRLAQENIIDDVTSRKYERDTDQYEVADAGIIAEFARIEEALKVPAPPPSYLTIEHVPGRKVPGIVLEDRETWFVGDF